MANVELKEYLSKMEADLNGFQNAMRENREQTSKQGFYEWFQKNCEIIKDYAVKVTASYLIPVSDTDREMALESTQKKYTETMILFYDFWQ